MKVSLPLSGFNSLLPSLPKKFLTYCAVFIMVKCIIVIGVIINTIRKEKFSCKARIERENLLEKQLIKEEKEFHNKEKELDIKESQRLYLREMIHRERCLKKVLSKKISRKRCLSLKDSSEVNRKLLGCQSTEEGVPLGKFRKFSEDQHPFQKEYDALPEDVKRELAKENSLFLGGKLERKTKFEIMRNADHVSRLYNSDYKRFVMPSSGHGHTLLDNKHGVIYKLWRDPEMDISSMMIRHHLNMLGIDNIILPKREFWSSRDKSLMETVSDKKIDPKDKSTRIAPIMLEKLEPDTYELDYEDIPDRDIINLVTSITRLFCFIEIGDLIFHYRNLVRIDLTNESGRYVVDKDNNDFKSRGRFDNIPFKIIKDKDGNESHKFVLVDLDVVRKPDHTTVETLLRIFPNQQQLIIDIIQDTNPSLFENYEPMAEPRRDCVAGAKFLKSTRNEMINNYRKELGSK